MADGRAETDKDFDFFVETYGVKYDKALERLVKDRERLLRFYASPAVYWKRIRTTNPIESTFTTVRQRTVKIQNCLSKKTALAMACKLILSDKGKWRKPDGSSHLAKITKEVPFKDGIKKIKHTA